jgi:hypothetical protein
VNTPRRWWALRPWRRHSLVLLVAGVVYVMIGVGYIFTPTNPQRQAALHVPLALFPLCVWGSVFIAVGLLAILSARWPPASESWGYTTMSGLSSLWAMFYVWGMIFGGSSTNITGASLFALLAFMWWAISGLRNPDELPAPAPLVPGQQP